MISIIFNCQSYCPIRRRLSHLATMRILLLITGLFALTCDGANSISLASVTSSSRASSCSSTTIPTANAFVTLYPKVPEYLSTEDCTIATTRCEWASREGVFSWAFDATTTCFQCAFAPQPTSSELPTLTSEVDQTPIPVSSSFPPTDMGFQLEWTTAPSPKRPSSMPQIVEPPISSSSASYVEYLASFVSSVAVNNVPTMLVNEAMLSKISIWTVGLPSQSATAPSWAWKKKVAYYWR